MPYAPRARVPGRLLVPLTRGARRPRRRRCSSCRPRAAGRRRPCRLRGGRAGHGPTRAGPSAPLGTRPAVPSDARSTPADSIARTALTVRERPTTRARSERAPGPADGRLGPRCRGHGRRSPPAPAPTCRSPSRVPAGAAPGDRPARSSPAAGPRPRRSGSAAGQRTDVVGADRRGRQGTRRPDPLRAGQPRHHRSRPRSPSADGVFGTLLDRARAPCPSSCCPASASRSPSPGPTPRRSTRSTYV